MSFCMRKTILHFADDGRMDYRNVTETICRRPDDLDMSVPYRKDGFYEVWYSMEGYDSFDIHIMHDGKCIANHEMICTEEYINQFRNKYKELYCGNSAYQ